MKLPCPVLKSAYLAMVRASQAREDFAAAHSLLTPAECQREDQLWEDYQAKRSRYLALRAKAETRALGRN